MVQQIAGRPIRLAYAEVVELAKECVERANFTVQQKIMRNEAFDNSYIEGHAIQSRKKIMTKKEAVATLVEAFSTTEVGDKARVIQMSEFKDQTLQKAIDQHLHSKCYGYIETCKDELKKRYDHLKEGKVTVTYPSESGVLPHNIKGDNTALVQDVIKNCHNFYGASLACDYTNYDSNMKTDL